jgi:hypothetical protein
LAEAQTVGNLGLKVLAARRAAAAGAAAGGNQRRGQEVIASKVSRSLMLLKLRSIAFLNWLLFTVLLVLPAACNRSERPSITTFNTPDDASNALIAVAKSGDQAAVLSIFGPDSKQLISSGDAVEDKNAVDGFISRYEVMHRWRRLGDGAQILLVGADNFPFPVPLKRDAGGKWFFDTAAGKEEILNRRIGRNELAIIEVCEAAAEAQVRYFSRLHDGAKTKQYAMKFISDPGKQNGLYWKSAEGQPESPLGPLAAFATSEGYTVKPDAHTPFHGYYFRMLKGQSKNAPGGAKDYVVDGKMTGGFAFVAYPAEYGNSGVMTFIINLDGLLLQKDLGKATAETAATMTEYDPDTSWSPVQQ